MRFRMFIAVVFAALLVSANAYAGHGSDCGDCGKGHGRKLKSIGLMNHGAMQMQDAAKSCKKDKACWKDKSGKDCKKDKSCDKKDKSCDKKDKSCDKKDKSCDKKDKSCWKDKSKTSCDKDKKSCGMSKGDTGCCAKMDCCQDGCDGCPCCKDGCCHAKSKGPCCMSDGGMMKEENTGAKKGCPMSQ